MGRKKLSNAGEVGAGGLQCPRCGSAQFTAKRSKKGKLTIIGAVAGPKSQVKCVACGKMFKRG